MSLALPAAIPAKCVVGLGPNLVLGRLNFRGFFSEGLILATTDTSKHDKTPVALCVCHKRFLAPTENRATNCNFTEGLPSRIRFGRQSAWLFWLMALRMLLVSLAGCGIEDCIPEKLICPPRRSLTAKILVEPRQVRSVIEGHFVPARPVTRIGIDDEL